MRMRQVCGTVAAVAVAGMLGVESAANADPVRPSNPISGWTFDGDTRDLFGENDGTTPDGTTLAYSDNGKFGGKSLDLTGNTGSGQNQLHVHIGNPESLQLTTNMTVAMWVRVNEGLLSGNPTLYPIAKFGGNQNQWAIITALNSQRFRARLAETHTATKDAVPANYHATDQPDGFRSLNDGQWHHLAFTLDSEEGVSVYLDGVKATEVSGSAKTGNITEVFDGAANIVVGARSDLAAETFFRGHIGETAIWGEVLSDDEIAWLSQNSIGTIPKPDSMGLLSAGACLVLLRRRA